MVLGSDLNGHDQGQGKVDQVPSAPVADSAKASVALKSRQDFAAFYQGQEQPIWPEVWNNGSCKADKLVLESPDLGPWYLSITESDCPGTSEGSPKILGEWIDVEPDFHDWFKITLKLGSFSPDVQIDIPLTLTSYVKEPDTGELTESDRTTFTHRWTTRITPAYKQSDESKFPQPRTITVSALPTAEDERVRLKQDYVWADFEPTGFYLNPNAPLAVRVAGDAYLDGAGPKPEILVGTPALVHPVHTNDEMPGQLNQQPSQPLNYGSNTVSSPLGGILYIRYNHAAGQALPPPVTVTFVEGDAVKPFPLFRPGITTNDEWKAMLHATEVPFAELAGKRVLITGLAAQAKIYADKGQDPQALLDTYEGIIAAQDSISGLSASAADPRDRPSPLRPMVVEAKSSFYPNAWPYRAAIPSVDHEELWWQPQVCQSWMVWHELGHHRQHGGTWSWDAMGEATVNIYSLAARRLVPNIPSETVTHGTIEEWNEAKDFLSQEAAQRDFDTAEYFTQLAFFEQLRVAFGDGFYHRLHTISRSAEDLEDDADKKHNFMTLAAEITKQNLAAYFTKWGLKPEQRTIDEMSRQPSATQDYAALPVYGGQ